MERRQGFFQTVSTNYFHRDDGELLRGGKEDERGGILESLCGCDA